MSMLFSIIISIILAVVTVGAAEAAIILFDRGDMVQAICAGAIIGVINFYSPIVAKGATWLGPVFLFVMLGVSVVLIAWWHVEGSDFKEMIPILVLTVLTFFVTKAAASATCALIPNDFFRSVIMTIPTLVLIGTIGFYLYDLFQFRNEFGTGRERRYE